MNGSDDFSSRADYSIYSKENLQQSASLVWTMDGKVMSVSQIERSMGAFQFVSSTKTQKEYVQEADKALAEGRHLDAQFVLAQAYLLGEKEPAVTMKLAEVSAKLGSAGSFLRRLAQELLASDPENAKAKELYENVLKAAK